MSKLFFILLIFVHFHFSKESTTKNINEIKINEICTNNKNILADSYGSYSQWVELYNKGEKDIDISGFGLSNEGYIPLKWTFPTNTIIKSKGFLIVFLSDKKSVDGELHTNFKLDKNGDVLFFNSPNFELIEKLDIPKLEKDESYGRVSDNIFQKMSPTPCNNNIIIVEPPSFSKESGFYDNEFLLELSSFEGAEIYYTLDGSNPLNSTNVQVYTSPIKIYDRSNEPNFYAEIGEDENSPTYIGSFGGYKKPKYLLDKAMVVRAFTQDKEGKISKISSNTYFITSGNLAQYKDFTIISLVTNPENLFDPEKGIYVVGNDYIEAMKNTDASDFGRMWQLMYSCNFYKEGPEWEKESTLTIFEKGKITVSQNIGIKIRGFSTRMQAGKSFNVYAKKKYGESSIKTALFPNNYDVNNNLIDKYKSIALRNVFSEERIKDEFANKLLYGREFQSISDTKKSILFLNGEYWGFYIIVEKFSESYIQSHFNVPKEAVTLIKEGELSSGEESEIELYNNFIREYSEKDLKDEIIYEEIQKFIDIDSFIEHFVIGIYLGTWDWPGHNDGVWRYNGEKIENNPYSDGRWRYISFDFDYSMGFKFSFGEQDNTEGYAIDNLKNLEMRKNIPTVLFLPLLNNEEFKKKYVLRFCDYVNEVINIDKVNSLIEDYKDNYLDKLTDGEVRWKGYDYDNKLEAFAKFKTNYLKIFDDIKTFFVERPKYTLQHMKEYLHLDGELIEITLLIVGEGNIKINSIIPGFKDGKWVGKYFSNIPITITALSSEKMKFKGWNGDITSDEEKVSITVDKDFTIYALFE